MKRKQLSNEDHAEIEHYVGEARRHARAIVALVEGTNAKLLDRGIKVERAVDLFDMAIKDERNAKP